MYKEQKLPNESEEGLEKAKLFQKERLEQELRFLMESLEADVISKDEYEKGKARIERKLREIEQKTEEKIEETEQPKDSGEIEIKEIHEETKIIGKEETVEEKKPEMEEKEKIEEEKKEEVKEEKKEEPEDEKPTKELKEAEEEKKEKIEEEEQESKDFPTSESKDSEEPEEEITISKKWLYGAILLIIAVILIFSIRSYSKDGQEIIEESIPECSSDSDCKQEGMIGTCINLGEKEAKCEFEEDARVELMVINDKDCELCSPSRMKGVIKDIFPNLEIKNLDYKTTEAKELVSEFSINSLPAYIFNSNVSKATNFNDFKSALIKKENNYVINNRASGANYYFKREKIDNKLDVFLTAAIEEKVSNNIKAFLDLFEENIKFTGHLVNQKQKEELSEELGITSYPAFLINNQIKVGGFQSADAIKEKFCQLNKLDDCEEGLQKDLQ